MEEVSFENLDRPGIILFSPNEKEEIVGETFAGERRLIPEIGYVYLWGSREEEYLEGEMGMVIVNDEVVTKPAEELKGMGLYALYLTAKPLSELKTPLFAQLNLKLTQQQVNWESQFGFGVDPHEDDPYYRHYGLTNKWKIPGESDSLLFFVPKDPSFLSKLQFSFSNHPVIPSSVDKY